MGVYIQGMEMPKSCSLCKLKTAVGPDKEKCLVSGVEFYSWDAGWGDEQRRHESCPLIPVPPHGRLIDADAVLSQYKGNILTAQTDYAEGLRDVANDIMQAPTIIPASEEE